MASEEKYMRLAKGLALQAEGETFPNPLVGAVVVKDKRIVGKGYHRRAGLAHAEVEALKQAGEKARGAALYVTLEPCSHFGRTPPCVDAILKSGIKRVVVGMKDPNPLNNGKSIRFLRRRGIAVKVGVIEEALRPMNAPFIKYITRGLPYITIKAGQSLDGKIATESGESKWITAKKTREFTHRLRRQYDAILAGINTVLKDNPSLNCPGKRIKKIIVDSRLRLPLRARIFLKTRPEDIVVATTALADKHKLRVLERRGVGVIKVRAKS
ncbi:MAG: bifunctional diaminohydroxyphosphoribosylaminopyrimidine deaminase/5-amino-6-(5-phosphoribosylamino)uracil reductase RibD, partial [Candidatus Omnitrophota bacterium]